MRHVTLVAIALAAVVAASPASGIDLVVDEMNLDPAEAEPGGSLIVQYFGEVDGNGTVGGPFTIGFYLSTDDVISTATDTFLDRATESSAQHPNDFFAGSRSVTIPSGTLPGRYYLGVVLDDTNAIPEEDEDNNDMSQRMTVTGFLTEPNLVAGPCSVAPSTARPGDEVQLTWRGRNAGSSTVLPFEWRVYVSTDATLGPGDTLVETGTVLGGWVNGYDTGDQFVTVALDPNLTQGTYYVGIFVDSSDLVTEASETDNQCVAELVVTTAAGVARWLIPAAASGPGLNQTNWKSQLEIVNPGTETRTVSVFYAARNAAWPGTTLLGPISLPGQSAYYVDDPLLQLNPTTGLLHVSLDAPGPVVMSRTYNLAPGGATYGQGIAAMPLDGVTAPQRLVLPMAHSVPGRYRTNLGLVQASTGSYTVEVSLHNEQGLVLATATYTRSAAFDQITDIFNAMGVQTAVEGGWIVVRLISGSPTFWTCYASVVDDVTGDPTFVAPVRP